MRAGVVVIVLAATAGAVAAYQARRTLARDALTGWLAERGIESEIAFDTFDVGDVRGRLRVGPATDPDVVAEVAEVRYAIVGPWAGEGFGVRPTVVRLRGARLKASYLAGRLSLGSLDPLVEELRRRPPRPDARQPVVIVEDGRLALATDYGPVAARGALRMEDGRLMRLDARLAPLKLDGRGLVAETGEVQVLAATTGRRLDLLVRGPVARLKTGAFEAQGAALQADAQIPYPDVARQRGSGRVTARARLSGARLAYGESRLSDAALQASFEGEAGGWIDTLSLTGDAAAEISARGAQAAGARAEALSLRAHATDVKWSRTRGDVAAAHLWVDGRTGGLRTGEVRLASTELRAQGPAAWREGRPSLALRGRAAGRGGWTGLGAPARGDSAETAALKRAVQDFAFEASALRFSLARGSVTAALDAPIRLRTDSGGDAVLSPVAGRPLYRDGMGALAFTARGGGLPSLDVAVDRYSLADGALSAGLALKAEGAFGPIVGGALDTAGELRVRDGAARFSAARCSPVRVGRLELGENDVEAVAGEICPGSAPLFTWADGGWRVRGTARGLSAEVPFLEARVEQAAGPVAFGARGEDLSVDAEIRSARLEDMAAETRFHPVSTQGSATLVGGRWRADFSVADLAGRRLGAAQLSHEPNGRGRMDFDTGELILAEGGLQPAELSPLAEPIASPAEGRLRFVGEVAWSPESVESGGVLDIDRLDFVSPAGPVEGLTGEIVFTSLSPLTAAPGQVLRAARIETATVLTGSQVTFGLSEGALQVEGGRFELGEGVVTLEPFSIPFGPRPSWSGVVNVQGVQVRDLVEASPFGDRMDLEARLTGRIPYRVTPEGLRVSGGRLYAVEPGRLSIRREALTGVSAEGAASAPGAPAEPDLPPNTFTEFAYQAMEHLSFDRLEADINSLEGGRLGVLFRIQGEHRPPQRQQIRLSLMEVIRRTYLEKVLPLPSGTKVDLTLDTSVNFDELLRDFAEFQSLRGSQAVQP